MVQIQPRFMKKRMFRQSGHCKHEHYTHIYGDLPAVASTATREVGGDDSNGHLTQFSGNSYLL